MEALFNCMKRRENHCPEEEGDWLKNGVTRAYPSYNNYKRPNFELGRLALSLVQ